MSVLDKVSFYGDEYDLQDAGAVRFDDTQSLTTDQKKQARINVGAEDASGIQVVPNVIGYVQAGAGATTVEVDEDGNPVNAGSSTSTVRFIYMACSPGDKFSSVVPSAVSTNTRSMMFLGAVDTSTTPHTRPILMAPAAHTDMAVFTAPAGTELVYFAATKTQINNDTYRYYIGARTDGRLNALENSPIEERVVGNTPTVVAEADHRYNCTGTGITDMSFTPCESGLCEVRFKTGSNPVWDNQTGAIMPDWFTGLESNRVYEMSFFNMYGVVMSWAIS